MPRVVTIGSGGSGKSTLAVKLGEITELPVVELDKVFWRPGLVETTRDEWVAIQQRLVEKNEWILVGDLGPYDAVEVRLRVAGTVVFLDFSLVQCGWRAARRSRERLDFWSDCYSVDAKADRSSLRRLLSTQLRRRSTFFATPQQSGDLLQT